MRKQLSEAVVIEERPAPTVVASDDVAICLGVDTAMLTANGNGDFTWAHGDMGTPIVVASTESTTYTVIVSSPDCEITSSDELTVTVNEGQRPTSDMGTPTLVSRSSDSSEPGNIISWEWDFETETVLRSESGLQSKRRLVTMKYRWL